MSFNRPDRRPCTGSMPGTSRLLVAAAALMTGVAGCDGGQDARREGSTERDSAGIMLVENRQPRTERELTLTPISFDAGSLGLEEVRLVTTGPTGGLVLGDPGTGRVVVLEPGGRQVLAFGRIGAGPGEFRALRAVELDEAGKVVAFDPGNARVTWFSASGEIERERTVAGAMAVGAFRDGSLLLRRIDAQEALAATGIHRPRHLLIRLPSDGSAEIPLLSVPGDEAMYEQHPRMGLIYGPVPFGRTTLTALGSDRLVVADNRAFEIRHYSLDGKLERIVRRQVGEIAVTREHLEQYLSALPGGDTEEGRGRLREAVGRVELPRTLPFLDALQMSRRGTVWVRSYAPPGERVATWSVFSSTGELQLEAALPAAFRASSATDSSLFGVMETDDGVVLPVQARITPDSIAM